MHYQTSVSEDDGSELQTDFETFEVVPQELDDAEMWDVNDPNEDELKASQIKSTIFVNMCTPWSTDRTNRAWLTHSRGGVSRPRPCQSKKNENRTHQRRLHALLSQFERRPAFVVP